MAPRAFELFLVGSLGLTGQGEPSSTWSRCWARSLGAGEPALWGRTVFWNHVKEALIISKRLLKKLPSVGNVGICTAQGSAPPVSPATCLGNYPQTGWQPPCGSRSLGCIGAVLQVRGAIACCSGQLQATPRTGFGDCISHGRNWLYWRWNGGYIRNILVRRGNLYVGVQHIYYLCVYKQAKLKDIHLSI